MTNIYLIRHGEAEGNDFRRMHGHYDSLLMPRGLKQAECVADRMKDVQLDAVFSSDLARASMTAIPLCRNKNLQLHRDPAFREIQMGRWEDAPYGFMIEFEKELFHTFHHDPVRWNLEGAESFTEYTDRFISRMETLATEYSGGTIVIFCHGAIMKGVLIRLFFMDNLKGIPMADNTGVSHLIYHNGSYSYQFVNDSSHVPKEISTFEYQSWWRNSKMKPDMYFMDHDAIEKLPAVLDDLPIGELNLVGIWNQKPVASVAMGAVVDGCGEILGMRVLPELCGKNYSDQLLGCAFSYFRNEGASRMRAVGDAYPENILACFGFSEDTRERTIDTKNELQKALQSLQG